MDSVRILKNYEDYLRIEKRLAVLTVDTYIRECRHFNDYLSTESVAVETASHVDIIRYLTRRHENEFFDRRTMAKIISSISSFCKYLVIEGLRRDNPVELIDMPKLGRALPVVYSIEEIDSLLASIDVSKPNGLRDRALFELIYSCGLRISEAADLELNRVFFDENFIRVLGKGDKERYIPIGGEARFRLKKYI
ncbi:MAG: site-specific integrase, partial [Spirochaetales bacterium]|nr:site-specific integrase [Spirochaetales bacterium]